MSVPPQLTFMAIVTLALLSCVQGASIYMLVKGAITAQEYLSVWVPLMTSAVGYWLGKQGTSAS